MKGMVQGSTVRIVVGSVVNSAHGQVRRDSLIVTNLARFVQPVREDVGMHPGSRVWRPTPYLRPAVPRLRQRRNLLFGRLAALPQQQAIRGQPSRRYSFSAEQPLGYASV